MTSLVIHGHFYQPPRENPWTDVLERQPSAQPDHDWNTRIHRECYRPNAYARIYGEFGRVDQIVNNYAYINFNFGPTLLSWMEKADPETYLRILEADRDSLARLGHGNAISQAFGHAILPLCNPRDRVTQVRWGIADFEHRFRRKPESMWLSETACNDDTLGTLIDEGMRYLILSPHQCERVRPMSHSAWQNAGDGNVDPTRAYRYFHKDGSRRHIDLFFYDGPMSRSLAFEGVLASSQSFVFRLKQGGSGPDCLVHVATDGESYGHHTRFGDLSLAHAVKAEALNNGFTLTNYATYLDQHPPTWEAEIKAGPEGEGTAWSCAHGVGRWIRDCGCNTGALEGWNQSWRGPLRSAFDILRDANVSRFERDGAELFADPWAARDAYVQLIVDPSRSQRDWLDKYGKGSWDEDKRQRALTLLELQRNALLMYTSCAWFFSDIAGIETIQVMRYAARVMELMQQLGYPVPRDAFIAELAKARSNRVEHGTGADIFLKEAEVCRVQSKRVAAHLGIMGLVEGTPHLPDPTTQAGSLGVEAGYRFAYSKVRRQRHGRLGLFTAQVALEHVATLHKQSFAVAALHMGGVDFYCACGPMTTDVAFNEGAERLWNKFRTGTMPQLLRIADEAFGHDEYGLDGLLHDGHSRVSQAIYGNLVARFSDQVVNMFESNQRLLEMLQEAGLELPDELLRAAEFTLGRRFEDEIARAHGSFAPETYNRAIEIAAEVKRRGYKIDTRRAGRLYAHTLSLAISAALHDPTREKLASASGLASLGSRLGLDPNLGRAQELVYAAFARYPDWIDALRPLALAVGVKPPV